MRLYIFTAPLSPHGLNLELKFPFPNTLYFALEAIIAVFINPVELFVVEIE